MSWLDVRFYKRSVIKKHGNFAVRQAAYRFVASAIIYRLVGRGPRAGKKKRPNDFWTIINKPLLLVVDMCARSSGFQAHSCWITNMVVFDNCGPINGFSCMRIVQTQLKKTTETNICEWSKHIRVEFFHNFTASTVTSSNDNIRDLIELQAGESVEFVSVLSFYLGVEFVFKIV